MWLAVQVSCETFKDLRVYAERALGGMPCPPRRGTTACVYPGVHSIMPRGDGLNPLLALWNPARQQGQRSAHHNVLEGRNARPARVWTWLNLGR